MYSDKLYFVHKEQRKGKDVNNAELASNNKVIKLSSNDGLERPYSRTITTKGKDKAVNNNPETSELREGHKDKKNDNASADNKDLGDNRDSVEL
jgi:hypothetical protein